VLAAIVGLYMGLAAWGQGWCGNLLPGVAVMFFDLPAFVAAGVISGNVHAPSDALFGVLSCLQWAFVAYLFFSRVLDGTRVN
jgi:ABC-type dipeptide/oligopeptide/nickel transport system permease subunit